MIPRGRRIALLNALQTFEVAARRGNFADAAAELGVTPSAVSHQIKRLESDLGIPLFERRNRLVVLTAKGRELATPLNGVFGNLYVLVDRIKSSHSSTLVISVMSSFAAKWLAPRIAGFSAANPDLKVRLVSDDRLTDFHRESVDVGIRYGEGVYDGLRSRLLMQVDAFPVCSRKMLDRGPALLDPADVRHYQLLHDESSLKAAGLPDWKGWLEAVKVATADPSAGPVFETPQLALEAALAGHGIALGLSPLVADDLRSGRLIRPFTQKLSGKFAFWLVCLPERANSRKIRRLETWLKTAVERFDAEAPREGGQRILQQGFSAAHRTPSVRK